MALSLPPPSSFHLLLLPRSPPFHVAPGTTTALRVSEQLRHRLLYDSQPPAFLLLLLLLLFLLVLLLTSSLRPPSSCALSSPLRLSFPFPPSPCSSGSYPTFSFSSSSSSSSSSFLPSLLRRGAHTCTSAELIAGRREKIAVM